MKRGNVKRGGKNEERRKREINITYGRKLKRDIETYIEE